jgi:hypothetical protein
MNKVYDKGSIPLIIGVDPFTLTFIHLKIGFIIQNINYYLKHKNIFLHKGFIFQITQILSKPKFFIQKCNLLAKREFYLLNPLIFYPKMPNKIFIP